jgi:hypothetical protein
VGLACLVGLLAHQTPCQVDEKNDAMHIARLKAVLAKNWLYPALMLFVAYVAHWMAS